MLPHGESYMAKQVKWNAQILEDFENLALLSDEECYIMESRCRGISVTAQALKLHKSEASIHKIISRLKKKYDSVQEQYPDRFPERKKSATELWMDSH